MINEENAGEGREVHKGTLNLMWGGVWVPLGEAEFLVEQGKVVKVLSYTPKVSTDPPTEDFQKSRDDI